jgi:hypothetical protein
MSVSREWQHFPTRNYPYRARAVGEAAAPDVLRPEPNTLYRRVLGIDAEPRPMTADELKGLADPFGQLLRLGGPFPLTVRDLLATIDALSNGEDTLPDQLVFFVADGGHIPWTPDTDSLQRAFRFVIARGRGEFSLLISASTAVDSSADQAFLQIIGWDPTHHVFHFYERLQGTFFWAGMSRHALEDSTRGRGPFDSHVNGALVMKELRSPWIHWHAPQAGINEEALAPDDPLRHDPLFRERVTAERLEIEVVRPAIRRWNESRVAGAVGADGVWREVRNFLRQAVFDTTVNLATSETASRLLQDDEPLRPPLTLFVNRDILFNALGLDPDDETVSDISVKGRLYRQCLTRYDVHRTDGSIRLDGDAHFAFLVPEPAFEDTHLVEAMMRAGLLSERFVACLAMTDFSNPVFSARRAALLRYVPEQATGTRLSEDLERQFVAAVRAAVSREQDGAGRSGSSEQEFLANWDTTDYKAEFVGRITAYMNALREGATDPYVVDGWFRLAEYRRRKFRARPLSEFKLTTPHTNIPEDAPALRMDTQGRVEAIHPTEQS